MVQQKILSNKRYGPIHTPSQNIYRGQQLSDRFLQTKYSDVDKYLTEIGDAPEILRIFDDMYQRVRYGELPPSHQLSGFLLSHL